MSSAVVLEHGSVARLPWHATLVLLLVGGLTGCSDSSHSPVPVYQATGEITFQGQPMPGAFVALHPKSPLPDVPNPRASIDREGKLKISTFNNGDGAPEGEYVVTVEWYRPIKSGADVVPGPNVLPKKYASPQSSGLVVTIVAADNQLPPIRL